MDSRAARSASPNGQHDGSASAGARAIALRHVSRRFGGGSQRVAAMEDVTLDIPPGCFFTLLGESGSGKTTTLRCIAGLEDPDQGEIQIAGQTVFSSRQGVCVPAHRRNIGMVFQSYALWPHMTVFQNVAYPLEARRLGGEEIARRVRTVLEHVGLADKASSPAPNLSGGQQQRVALARALVMEPSILLLDEPLSNLDARLRDEMRRDLLVLQRRLRTTTLYVTHDQEEALALSDVIGVMSRGRVVEVGSPVDIYHEPKSALTAGFVGVTNVIPGEVAGRAPSGHVLVRTALGVLACRCARAPGEGQPAVVFVRPERMRLEVDGAQGPPNRVPAVVEATSFLGSWSDYWLLAGDLRLRVRREFAQAIAPGTEVVVAMPAEACLAFAGEDVSSHFLTGRQVWTHESKGSA